MKGVAFKATVLHLVKGLSNDDAVLTGFYSYEFTMRGLIVIWSSLMDVAVNIDKQLVKWLRQRLAFDYFNLTRKKCARKSLSFCSCSASHC